MVQEFTDLESHETLLGGRAEDRRASTEANDVDERIFWLVTKRLMPQGRSPDGWSSLFVDPRDGRFWELTFPHGSLFGGGPRRLTLLSPQVAEEKYGRKVAD